MTGFLPYNCTFRKAQGLQYFNVWYFVNIMASFKKAFNLIIFTLLAQITIELKETKE